MQIITCESVDIPSVYWINLDSNHKRRKYMENQFKRLNIQNIRISASTANSTSSLIAELEKPCKRNTDRDIAVILSHLTAIHTAICFPVSNNNSSLDNYALIVEDDVRWLNNILYPNYGINIIHLIL